MRRTLVGGLAIAITLTLAVVSAMAAPAAAAKNQEATGTLKSIDSAARTIVVDTSSGTHTFKLEAKAAIMEEVGSKNLTLSALKTGERVRVAYTTSGKDMLASKLWVLPERHAQNMPSEP